MTSYDVAIAGGGPAGAFTAHELARAGLSILLIDPAVTRPRLEGLGERVAHLLEKRGLHEALAAAGRPVRRSIAWAGLQEPSNGERLVRRHDFDAALRRAAVEAGAIFLQARVSRVESAGLGDGVSVKLSSGETVTARLLVDARGRQAPSATRLKGPQTLAISALLTTPPQTEETHVEAAPQGWMWSAQDPDFGHWLQICVDPDGLKGAGQEALAERMHRFLSQPRFKDRFPDTSFQGPLFARHAGLVLAAPKLDGPVIPVGDAAVAIDPLSGHGLFWALSSALSAVPSVLSILDGPETGYDLATRFFHDRVVATFWRQARVGRDFYRLEKDLAGEPFWEQRAVWPDDTPAHTTEDGVRMDRRVVVDNNRLKERDILVTPEHPDGIAFIAGVPVSDLTGFLRAPVPTDEATTHPSPAFAAALQWLESRGLLHDIKPTKTRETA
ncbi:NAD(P)/FAD-dependent oxidoreductase [Roseibium aggregatum]|uniref:flavin-dependent monooxygenase QhpG n=1 Tax=Roseibium aggregatum TaxID=187304 RepID=UPI001AD900BD|nr:lycopene cyclase family protein [Roseibium aggregatum]